jgi:hypothetical protein
MYRASTLVTLGILAAASVSYGGWLVDRAFPRDLEEVLDTFEDEKDQIEWLEKAIKKIRRELKKGKGVKLKDEEKRALSSWDWSVRLATVAQAIESRALAMPGTVQIVKFDTLDYSSADFRSMGKHRDQVRDTAKRLRRIEARAANLRKKMLILYKGLYQPVELNKANEGIISRFVDALSEPGRPGEFHQALKWTRKHVDAAALAPPDSAAYHTVLDVLAKTSQHIGEAATQANDKRAEMMRYKVELTKKELKK